MTMSESNWVTGINAVLELLKQNPQSARRVLLKRSREDSRLNTVRNLAKASEIELDELDAGKLHRMYSQVHQGVAVELAGAERSHGQQGWEGFLAQLEGLDAPPLLLVLDGITDPHNLGACLRSADAAGVNAVVIPKDKAVGLNATVRRVASGAADTVELFVVSNLSRALTQLKERGVWLVGTDDNAGSGLYEQDLRGAVALVMGSEGRGLRRLTREKCDFLISIPMAGAISSLNVSVATGVVLFEAVRQRRNQP